MAGYDFDLGVLGGGAGGLSAAAGGANLGAKVLLIEKGKALGGDCLHYGCVPSKSLIKAANLWHEAAHAGNFGLPKIPTPPVNLKDVMARIKTVIASIQEHDSPQRFASLGVTVVFGEPRFLDNHSVHVGKDVYTAKNWIVATGARPSIPPLPGLETIPYLTNETAFSLTELPQTLTVLGGGPVGLELAQAFSRLGSKVTVVEFARLLPSEDPEISEFVKERLEEDGLTILTATKGVEARHKNGDIFLDVEPVAGGERRTLQSAALLVATGRRPNVEGLNLEAAGVKFDGRGISTDGALRTSAPNVYAIGDVNGKYPFTHVANYEAGVALSHAILHLPGEVAYDNMPFSIYTTPEVAGVGPTEAQIKCTCQEYQVLRADFSSVDRARIEDSPGFIKVLVSPKGMVLGARIVGPRASELIQEWVLMMNAGVGLSKLARSVHSYPTLSEINKKVAQDYYQARYLGERSRSFLRFLFHLKGNRS